MSNPFFTIGVPVHNAEKYLCDCVDSILSQSFTDFELILVENGSVDTSLEICKAYEGNDSRVKVIRQGNTGVAVARNRMLDECKGRYMFQIDSDDTMKEGTLEEAYNCLVKHNMPDLMICNGYEITPGGVLKERIYEKPSREWHTYPKDLRTMRMLIDYVLPSPGSEKFVKATLFKENNLRFIPGQVVAEDADFTIKLYRHADRIVYEDFHSFYWYHPREGSITTDYPTSAAVGDLKFYNMYMNEIQKWNMTHREKEEGKLFYLSRIRQQSTAAFRMNRRDAVMFANLVDEMVNNKQVKQDLKKLPAADGQVGTLFKLYNIIGVKNTILLFNSYLRMKGIIE